MVFIICDFIMGEKFVLEVLNPRNAMKIEEFQGLSAPRLITLDGKRIAIVRETGRKLILKSASKAFA